MRESRPRESQRYLGIDVAGAKNNRTAVAVLEFYPRERKIFLLDIFERVAASETATGDQALLALVDELREGVASIGVNVPMDLPPCMTCTRKSCPLPSKCTVPAVKWMRQISKKGKKTKRGAWLPEFTPYTQRPIELWVRHQLLPELPEWARFEIDEALGGNKAPLTARMSFLQRHLEDLNVTETWPKLSISLLAESLGLSKRTTSTYRHLEQGLHAREEILEALIARHGVFIYERDMHKLAANLAAFDAFFCAYTALLSDTQRCARKPASFAPSSGWISYPDPQSKAD